MEFTKEDFEGKKIGDIITDDTKILTEFKDGFDVKEVVLRWVSIKKHDTVVPIGSGFSLDALPRTYHVVEASDYSLPLKQNDDYILCFIDKKPVALFNVYDLEYVSLNGKRGLVTARGHETVHEYWFDDGEYKENYTR